MVVVRGSTLNSNPGRWLKAPSCGSGGSGGEGVRECGMRESLLEWGSTPH
jgi:hypothetical protein